MDWPVGRVLGNETALIDRYQVSRAVLREAIRQLEHRGIARMQRGRAGGLMVTLPLDQAAVRAIAGYLEAVDVDLRAILKTQVLLELKAGELAAERIDRAGAERLRALATALPEPTGDADVDAPPHTEVRAAIAEAAGNRALALFIRALNLSSIEIRSMLIGPGGGSDYVNRVRRSIADKHALVEAIVGVEPARAGQIIVEDMRAQTALLARLAGSEVQRRELRSLMREAGEAPKLSQALMLRMAEDVARGGAAPGTRLGSEAEMLERYGVGRAVFREAIRLLEQHGVVRMRRGVGGGLFVGAPDMGGAIAMAVGHIREMALRPDELREARAALQIGMVGMIAMRGTAIEAAGPDEVSRTLAALTGNAALELLLRILIMVDPLPDTPQLRLPTGDIVRAIDAGDVALARRLMKDLLES